MTKTRDELVNRALQELRIIGEGQSASPEETATARAEIDPLVAELRQLQIYNASDPHNGFDDFAFFSLAMLLAEKVAFLVGRGENQSTVNYYRNELSVMQNQPKQTNTLQVDRALLRPRREPFEGGI